MTDDYTKVQTHVSGRNHLGTTSQAYSLEVEAELYVEWRNQLAFEGFELFDE